MTTDARRYLLAEADETEREAIEERYFRDENALDEIAAEEDALIEDYLTDRLAANERRAFETRYLASPVHRRRVAIMSSVVSGFSRTPVVSGFSRTYESLAAAAVLVLAIGAAWWGVSGPRPATRVATLERSAAQPPARQTLEQARVFAFSLPPVRVRSAADSTPLVIPEGTDVVSLRLEGERPSANAMRAEIQRVPGPVVWQATAAPAADGAAMVVEVPADRLPAEDYVVVLFESVGAAEQERNRYFLPVRSR